MSVEPESRIAIIGAGMAGLVAARTLVADGFSVCLFEKARGPGGRMATARRRHGDIEYAFDHGAQYFTARDKRFASEVHRWVSEGVVANWNGRIATATKGTFVEKESADARFVGVPRMSSLTRHLSAGLDIRFTTRIEKVERSHDVWQLVDDQGQPRGEFGVVILTTPADQTSSLLAEVPSLSPAVSGVQMNACWAVMATFDHSLPVAYDGLFIQRNPLSWAARDSSKPGRDAVESWVLHASPAWSEANLEQDHERVVVELLSAFAAATGKDRTGLGQPVFARAHRWRYAAAENPLVLGCLWDGELRVAVCGDWCNESRVEGAFTSGLAAASRVIESRDRATTRQGSE